MILLMIAYILYTKSSNSCVNDLDYNLQIQIKRHNKRQTKNKVKCILVI